MSQVELAPEVDHALEKVGVTGDHKRATLIRTLVLEHVSERQLADGLDQILNKMTPAMLESVSLDDVVAQLSPELRSSLEQVAERHRIEAESLLAQLMDEYIHDQALGRLAKERSDELREGRSRTYTLQEVIEMHGLDG